MERLIESVQKYPCLWNPDVEEYKLNVAKEVAWREVIQECDLPDVKEAKNLWRKLRDGHRQAISRKKTGQAANPKNLWKYEKKMEFLLESMQNRSRSTNIDRQNLNQQNNDDMSQDNEDSSNSEEQHQRADDFAPPTKKLTLTSLIEREPKREIRSVERDLMRRQIVSTTSIPGNTSLNTVQNTALGNFFMSMLLTANSLPEILQLRVQRQVFNIVMDAQEEYIATRCSSASSPANPLIDLTDLNRYRDGH